MGAGRKPNAGKRALAFVAGGKTDVVSVSAPADLPEDQRAFWDTYAKQAMEAGTLTDQTAASWRLLCELEAERTATKATIDRDGRTYIKVVVDGAGNEHQELKAHPLKSDYAKLAKQVETLMGRFGLAPFGKPVLSHKAKTVTSNPWARMAVGEK